MLQNPATFQVQIDSPKRWDEPFGEMTGEDVEYILSQPPFNRMDPSRFSSAAPLQGLIQNDTRIQRYKDGDIVVREGDYGNSAFFILEGKVRVVLPGPGNSLPARQLGRREPERKGFWKALSQLWTNHKLPEVRDPARYAHRAGLREREDSTPLVGERTREPRIFLADTSAIINDRQTASLSTGEMFGELAALGRIPRTATVFSEGDSTLLEIRWQGLRDLRKRDDELRRHIERLYRERNLKNHLRETPLFAHLDEATLDQVANHTIFETYGDFDWYASFQKLAQEEASDKLQKEPIIAEEGHYPNGLYLIRNGFARVSRKKGHGHQTWKFLARGQSFGMEEIAHNWLSGQTLPFQSSLRAIGYMDALIVPTPILEKHVLPTMPRALMPRPIEIEEPGGGAQWREKSSRIDSAMLEFLVENRFMNGTATMMINMDRCTRCDDCVRACAESHDNNPRFVRHGPIHDGFMIANACMHCVDPVCMIGCPTGAIHRDLFQGQVVINDTTCIGCGSCAASCPYNNIRLVEIRDEQGGFILNHENAPILKATKCDLCVDQPGGPSCQRACPHDAMKRVDMRDLDSLGKWLKR